MKKRIITIVCEVDRPEANWLWDSHIKGEVCNGIKIIGLANGDLIEEIQERDLEELSEDDL